MCHIRSIAEEVHLGEGFAEGIEVPEVHILDVAAPCAPETYTVYVQHIRLIYGSRLTYSTLLLPAPQKRIRISRRNLYGFDAETYTGLTQNRIKFSRRNVDGCKPETYTVL